MQLNYRVFVIIHRHFREFGLKRAINQPRRKRNNFENVILRIFENNSSLSFRRATLLLQTTKSVLRTLHRDHRRAFHLKSATLTPW